VTYAAYVEPWSGLAFVACFFIMSEAYPLAFHAPVWVAALLGDLAALATLGLRHSSIGSLVGQLEPSSALAYRSPSSELHIKGPEVSLVSLAAVLR
jgi:hypothetical protein